MKQRSGEILWCVIASLLHADGCESKGEYETVVTQRDTATADADEDADVPPVQVLEAGGPAVAGGGGDHDPEAGEAERDQKNAPRHREDRDGEERLGRCQGDVPGGSLRRTTSMRRLCARPSGVLFVSIGSNSPLETAISLRGSTP